MVPRIELSYFVKELLQQLSSVWGANNFRGHVQRVELRLRRGLWFLDCVFCYDVNWLRKVRYTFKPQRISQKFSASLWQRAPPRSSKHVRMLQLTHHRQGRATVLHRLLFAIYRRDSVSMNIPITTPLQLMLVEVV